MTDNTTTITDEEPTNKQAEYVRQIDTIVADPDEILKHLEKNIRNENTTYTSRTFKVVGIRSDGPCTLSAGVDPRDEGAYYDGTPHAVWISPRAFIMGFDHDSDKDAPRFPPRHETRGVVRDEYPEMDEDSEEFVETVDEWHEEALTFWHNEARHQLKDELEFEFRAVSPHPEYEERTMTPTVTIEYE